MKIQTKAALSIGISLLTSAIVLMIVFSSLREMEAERTHIQDYRTIKRKIDGLNYLTARGLRPEQQSRVRQIQEIEKSLGDLLHGLTASNAQEAFLVQQIQENSIELGQSIENLISAAPTPMEVDSQDILVSHVWMQAQLISDDCNRLLDISQYRINAAQKKTSLSILGLIAALVLANAAISFLFGRNIYHKQQHLQQALSKAEAGDRMLSALMEYVPEGITIADAKLNLLSVSRHGQELLGGSFNSNPMADVLAQWEVYHPDGTPMRLEEIPLARAVESGEVIKDAEVIQVSSQGARLPLLCSAGPMRDSAGAIVGGIVAFRDITERKQVEEALRERQIAIKASLAEKEVLLKEIHHRVKNNMQVISSLVDLQADQVQDPGMRTIFQDVINRVRAMAMVHEKLYQSSDLAQVDFADYAESLLGYLWRAQGPTAPGIQLDLDLKPVRLSINAAVPCGLILNELFTNAIKHAFKGRDSGKVMVSVCEDAQGIVRLGVCDDGIGLPPQMNWEQARSLGLGIVKTLTRQLNAKAEVKNAQGTQFTILFGR